MAKSRKRMSRRRVSRRKVSGRRVSRRKVSRRRISRRRVSRKLKLKMSKRGKKHPREEDIDTSWIGDVLGDNPLTTEERIRMFAELAKQSLRPRPPAYVPGHEYDPKHLLMETGGPSGGLCYEPGPEDDRQHTIDEALYRQRTRPEVLKALRTGEQRLGLTPSKFRERYYPFKEYHNPHMGECKCGFCSDYINELYKLHKELAKNYSARE